jgi:hypothetical protein
VAGATTAPGPVKVKLEPVKVEAFIPSENAAETVVATGMSFAPAAGVVWLTEGAT